MMNCQRLSPPAKDSTATGAKFPGDPWPGRLNRESRLLSVCDQGRELPGELPGLQPRPSHFKTRNAKPCRRGRGSARKTKAAGGCDRRCRRTCQPARQGSRISNSAPARGGGVMRQKSPRRSVKRKSCAAGREGSCSGSSAGRREKGIPPGWRWSDRWRKAGMPARIAIR